MAGHVESPFVAERVPGFQGLRYFPIDERFRVVARLARRPIPEEEYLRTNRDGQATMRYLGDMEFRIGRKPLSLRVYHAGEGVGLSVFIPFRDATSGSESYGPGRYLTLELNETDEYTLDFNRAFNPYCAYTDAYECGFPPAENDLPVAIRAGEKVWSPDRNPSTPNTVVRDLVARVRSSSEARAAPRPAARRSPRKPRGRGRSRSRPPARRSSRSR